MIREMTLDDLEIVCEMELRLFSSPWPRESYEYELKENPYSHLFVAENETGTIVGYAGRPLIRLRLQRLASIFRIVGSIGPRS